MVRCETCDFFETITASRVCRYSVNHSNVFWQLNQTLRISQGRASTYFRWNGHFLYIFVERLFLDIPANFHWNRFLFDRSRTKDKLAPFFL